MKEKTIFVADDGSRFDDKDRALECDALVAEVEKFKLDIGLLPWPLDAGHNGDYFILQPRGIRQKMFNFCKDHGWNRDIGGPIGRLCGLAYGIDSHDRMWGQPYFANNPKESATGWKD